MRVLLRNRKVQILLNGGLGLGLLAVSFFSAKHFVKGGWPLHHADPILVVAEVIMGTSMAIDWPSRRALTLDLVGRELPFLVEGAGRLYPPDGGRSRRCGGGTGDDEAPDAATGHSMPCISTLHVSSRCRERD